MSIEITMPRLSDTMEEGTLVKWRVNVGDSVSSGDHLADVETDKATMELQAFDDGKIAKLVVDEGETTAVGDLILILAEEGESVEEAAQAGGNGQQKAEKAEDGQAEDGQDDPTRSEGGKQEPAGQAASTAAPPPSGGVRVSPLARKLADEHGVDVNSIEGSGPDGRIIKRDILAAAEGKSAGKPAGKPQAAAEQAPSSTPPATVQPVGLESRTIKLSNMRKTIARRLVESKTSIPHFQITQSINMDPLLTLRKTLNEQLESQGVKLSVNDFITRAVAMACIQVPVVNSSWNGDAIIQHGTVNVGVAVALPEERGGGLVVPVLRDVQNKGLRQISAETKAIATKARESGLTVEEMDGGTITISNLGMYGIDQFNAIINPPQAAILAVGGAVEKPVVRNGTLTTGHEMNATLSADHRVVDGATAAEYLLALRASLENPASLLV